MWEKKLFIGFGGGLSVSNATLNSFYSLNYLLFILVGLMGVHLFFLHEGGSNNLLGVGSGADSITFYPHFIIKDISGNLIILFITGVILFFCPY